MLERDKTSRLSYNNGSHKLSNQKPPIIEGVTISRLFCINLDMYMDKIQYQMGHITY